MSFSFDNHHHQYEIDTEERRAAASHALRMLTSKDLGTTLNKIVHTVRVGKYTMSDCRDVVAVCADPSELVRHLPTNTKMSQSYYFRTRILGLDIYRRIEGDPSNLLKHYVYYTSDFTPTQQAILRGRARVNLADFVHIGVDTSSSSSAASPSSHKRPCEPSLQPHPQFEPSSSSSSSYSPPPSPKRQRAASPSPSTTLIRYVDPELALAYAMKQSKMFLPEAALESSRPTLMSMLVGARRAMT